MITWLYLSIQVCRCEHSHSQNILCCSLQNEVVGKRKHQEVIESLEVWILFITACCCLYRVCCTFCIPSTCKKCHILFASPFIVQSTGVREEMRPTNRSLRRAQCGDGCYTTTSIAFPVFSQYDDKRGADFPGIRNVDTRLCLKQCWCRRDADGQWRKGNLKFSSDHTKASPGKPKVRFRPWCV